MICSVQVAQSCPTLCDPMDCSTPDFPVHYQLQEFKQIHVHWVDDAIQSSHPLLSPSLPTFNLSQHQGLFKWVSSLHQVAKVSEFQLQHQSFHEQSVLISFRMDWLHLLAVQGTPCSPRDTIIKLCLFQECKDSLIDANQSMWHTTLTNWKIKTIW